MNTMLNPYGFQAFGLQQQLPSQSLAMMQNTPQQLVKVSGLEGAKAYQMPPNAAAALFHESEDIFYVKTTDGAGFPTIKTFRFEPFEVEDPAPQKYVTLEEFEAFKKEVLDAK